MFLIEGAEDQKISIFNTMRIAPLLIKYLQAVVNAQPFCTTLNCVPSRFNDSLIKVKNSHENKVNKQYFTVLFLAYPLGQHQ